jgi:hypothetical protein
VFSINPAAEEKAELQFSHTRIVALADGVIAKKTVEITSRPRKMNTSSTPVCTIRLSRIESLALLRKRQTYR